MRPAEDTKGPGLKLHRLNGPNKPSLFWREAGVGIRKREGEQRDANGDEKDSFETFRTVYLVGSVQYSVYSESIEYRVHS